MSLFTIAPLILTFLIGSIAILLSIRHEELKKKLTEKKKAEEQKTFEAAILLAIQEKIGFEFNLSDIIDILVGSIKNLLPYSTISSLLIKQDTLVLKTHGEEHVSRVFLEKVKERMIHSLTSLHAQHDGKHIEEHYEGMTLDESKTTPASFFTIPLIIKGKLYGLITIASKRSDIYKEHETNIIYKLSNNALQVLSRLHDALTIEKEKLMAMIGSLADGVLMIDVNKQLSVVNDSALKLLEINKPKPNIIDVLASFPKEYDISSHIDEAIQTKKKVDGKELKLGDKTVQLFITPVTTALDDGIVSDEESKERVIGVSVLLNDVTLEKTILQMKEDFTNMVVHELRAPLAAIKDSSELIIQTKAKLTSEEETTLLQIIHRQSARMLDEVSSILDAAKLDAGKFVLQKTTSDIKKVVDEKLEIFNPQAHNKQITLSVDVDHAIPQFLFDQKRIGQVINNLLSNSLKYTPDGGRVTISAKAQNSVLTVSVSDTGMGIPKDKQQQLFSKFFQVIPKSAPLGATGTKPTFGTGLGLYITKGIIDAHNGTIDLQSEEGKGTTISFSIPIEFEQKQPLTSPPPAGGSLTPPTSPSETHPDLPTSNFGTTIH